MLVKYQSIASTKEAMVEGSITFCTDVKCLIMWYIKSCRISFYFTVRLSINPLNH